MQDYDSVTHEICVQCNATQEVCVQCIGTETSTACLQSLSNVTHEICVHCIRRPPRPVYSPCVILLTKLVFSVSGDLYGLFAVFAARQHGTALPEVVLHALLRLKPIVRHPAEHTRSVGG